MSKIIIFIAVVIFSTTAFALIDNPKLPTDIDLDYISGGEALDYNNFSSLSAKYESSGNPGTIANNTGDPGGVRP